MMKIITTSALLLLSTTVMIFLMLPLQISSLNGRRHKIVLEEFWPVKTVATLPLCGVDDDGRRNSFDNITILEVPPDPESDMEQSRSINYLLKINVDMPWNVSIFPTTPTAGEKATTKNKKRSNHFCCSGKQEQQQFAFQQYEQKNDKNDRVKVQYELPVMMIKGGGANDNRKKGGPTTIVWPYMGIESESVMRGSMGQIMLFTEKMLTENDIVVVHRFGEVIGCTRFSDANIFLKA